MKASSRALQGRMLSFFKLLLTALMSHPDKAERHWPQHFTVHPMPRLSHHDHHLLCSACRRIRDLWLDMCHFMGSSLSSRSHSFSVILAGPYWLNSLAVFLWPLFLPLPLSPAMDIINSIRHTHAHILPTPTPFQRSHSILVIGLPNLNCNSKSN